MLVIMNSLKQKRLQLGIPIEDISSQLKIRKFYLLALENNDITSIPNKLYAKGYLKMYAKFLNLSYKDLSKELELLDYSDYAHKATDKDFFSTSSHKVVLITIITFIICITSFYMIRNFFTKDIQLMQELQSIDHAQYFGNNK